ncbi:hypothetical protein K1T71_010740 [Dendrolimus kikuchii]|uniref:Uncharacterized protein n=1 Tax=Dendrolimus kikuchii TaxID=765133 RepID=A0ACC1CPX8_9NEOP|nr:hypothetical protein K1T71_010740 [Dendrolimus kikuchii]
MEPTSNIPPTCKKRGRPPGSKNKRNKHGKPNTSKVKLLKTEDIDYSDLQFICTLCNAVVENDKLQEHIKLCYKTRNNVDANEQEIFKVAQSVFVCNECPKRFRFKKSYAAHLSMDHSKLPGSVSCEKCPVKCPNLEALRKHITKVHERDLYLCPTCNKEFVRRSHVIRHMAQSGCSGDDITLYPCEICDAKFTRKDNLAVHLRSQHILRKSYGCKICDYETKNFSKLTNHWLIKHTGNPRPQFQCDHCGKVTGSRAAMAKHLEIHGEKKFYCDVTYLYSCIDIDMNEEFEYLQCGYCTYTIEVMRRHVWTHVPSKPYKCEICNSSYIQRAQLERHLEKHTGIVCSKCNQTFTSKTRLIIHEREHMGLEKMYCPFKDCPLTNKEFSSDTGYNAHLKKHLEEKLYKCEVCHKQFHSEVNARRHLTTHTLDRPRRCMYCVTARAYVRGEQLVRHVRHQHPSVFRAHLAHVRQVLGLNVPVDRVKKSEMESILNVLDAESERILQGYGGTGVLYGGMQTLDENASTSASSLEQVTPKKEKSPLMTEEELADNLRKLLSKLIDLDTLECFGWPDETVDVVLEKVIEQCGTRPADRDKWTRVQRLRENTKHLFLYVIEDKTITKMLDTHTIDQIINHILVQVSEDDNTEQME